MATFARMSAGAIVWAVHFTAVYGATALACARGQAAAVPWVIALSTTAGVALVAMIFVRAYPRREAFDHWMAAAVAATAALAMLWEAFAGLAAGSCA